MNDELPGMPPAPAPRKGSNAWKRAEWIRFRELCGKHHGLTTPFFAAMLLNVSGTRVHQLINDGHIATVEVLGKRFILCDQLEEFSRLERSSGFRYGAESFA